MKPLKKSSPDAELADLVAKYLDNRLTSRERERLESRIQQEQDSMEYLAERLSFESTLREAINPQRMEVIESRRLVMEPGSHGPEWSVEQQRSVRIGRCDESLATDGNARKKNQFRIRFASLTLLFAASTFACYLWLSPKKPAAAPTLTLRNADFEATDLSLTPQGLTSTLIHWQEAFSCQEAELVEIARVSNGTIFPKSGKNVARLQPSGYLNQYLHYSDGSPLRARDGLTVRLTGWAWIDSPIPETLTTSLRVVASGRPDTILYDACRVSFTLEKKGWQRFYVDLPVAGDLMRKPYWVEPRVTTKQPLDLTNRALCLSIDMDYTSTPILLDELKMEDVSQLAHAPPSPVTLDLHHRWADVRGPAVRESEKDCIGNWENEQTSVVWSIRVHRPCEIEIECLMAAEARSAGNRFDVVIGEEKISGEVIDTGAWNCFHPVKLGRLKIPAAGEYEVAIVPHPKKSQAVMNLRSLRLSGYDLSAEVHTSPR